jgi:hypothetical protein
MDHPCPRCGYTRAVPEPTPAAEQPPMREIHRRMIVNGYFDGLADVLPEGADEKVRDELINYIHHTEDQPDAPLLHAVRFMIGLVREDERAKAEADYQVKHVSLKEHYAKLEASVKEAWQHALQEVRERSGAQLKAFAEVHQMALTARASGRKTLPADKIIAAVGLEPWENRG